MTSPFDRDDAPVAATGHERSAEPTLRTTEAPRRGARRDRGSLLPAVLAALVLGLLIGGAAMALLDRSRSGDGFGGNIDAARYQAVVLSNDKVYFGRITSASDQFFRLDHAFFLSETAGAGGAGPVRALLPVHREIHAPENSMLIRKQEVVLVENLATDSPTLTEIRRQLRTK